MEIFVHHGTKRHWNLGLTSISMMDHAGVSWLGATSDRGVHVWRVSDVAGLEGGLVWEGEALPHLDLTVHEGRACVTWAGMDVETWRVGVLCEDEE